MSRKVEEAEEKVGNVGKCRSSREVENYENVHEKSKIENVSI